MCKNWGYQVLADVHWHESIDEMKHADRVIERILFLESIPNVAASDKISVARASDNNWKMIADWSRRR